MYIYLLLFFLVFPNYCLSDEIFAQVIALRGRAWTVDDSVENKTHQLHNNDILHERSTVMTEESSLIKIQMYGKNIITLGPKAKIILEKTSQASPGYLKLMAGELRAQINNQVQSTSDYKFFIKTQTATMGVRGTEFSVIYNPENHITSTLTYQGEVILRNNETTKFFNAPTSPDNELDPYYQRNISEMLADERSKTIQRGEYSGSFPGYREAIIPVKISQKQFNVLEKREDLAAIAQSDGISLRISGNEKAMTASLQGDSKNEVLIPKPRAYYEENNYPQEIIVPPNGILDLKTGIYISPPENETEVPSDFGGVDTKTGDYVPPQGLFLHPLKGFILLEDGVNKLGNLTQEQLQKLNLLMNKLNGTISKNIAKIKEITKVDSHVAPSYYYDSNLTDELYGQITEISRKASMIFSTDAFIAQRTLETAKWLIYPKGKFLNYIHINRLDKELRKRDQANWTGALEINHRHQNFGRNGRTIIESGYHVRQQDVYGNDKYRWVNEDLYLFLAEEFKAHFKHTSRIGISLSKYQTFDSEKTDVWAINFLHHADLGRKNSVEFGANIHKHWGIVHKQFEMQEGFISHLVKNFWHKSQFITTVMFRHGDFSNTTIPARGQEYLVSPKFEFVRDYSAFLCFRAFYQFQRNYSKENSRFQFYKHLVGGSAVFIF